LATVDKAFAVLGALVDEGEASVQRLAEILDAPRSSVYRLVSDLQRLGAVEPGTTRGAYRLGLELLRLGSAVTARFDERQAALDAMEHLHKVTEETVFLCVRDGFRAVCVERIEGKWVRSMGLPLGGSLPLHVGAAPRTLLAFSPRALWDEYIEKSSLIPHTANTPSNPIVLRDMLEETRRLGCGISDGDVVVGMAAVGAPIFDFRGSLRAAISLSGPQLSILGENREKSIALVIAAAAAVSRELGVDVDDGGPPSRATQIDD
jgi:DNA-binding IclR family transcriptional regulator